MAFTPNPQAMLIAAKEKARTAAATFDGPRYGEAANSLWGDTNAAQGSGSSKAYGSGSATVDNLVPSTLTLPQGNSEKKSALYARAGSDALKGMFGSGLSALPGNYSTLTGIANQNQDAIGGLAHQQAMNEIEIAKSKIGGGSALSAVLGGVNSALGAFGSFGGFGGSGGSGFTPFSASNPVTYSSGFQMGSGPSINPWG
jgi:hypothetical protein